METTPIAAINEKRPSQSIRRTIGQTAAVSGQSLTMVEWYARRRNQSTLADAAMEAWESKS